MLKNTNIVRHINRIMCMQLKRHKNVKCLIFKRSSLSSRLNALNKMWISLAERIVQWRNMFYLQFLFWVHIKVQKGVFFNTKYLPKHQGVSCCDLLHLQYLSDASFSFLYCASFASSVQMWMQWKSKRNMGKKKSNISRYHGQTRILSHHRIVWIIHNI